MGCNVFGSGNEFLCKVSQWKCLGRGGGGLDNSVSLLFGI